jgi:TonB family protein
MSFSLASDIVELIVLTTDDAFLKTFRGAVSGSRRLWHVPTADKVSDLLVAGQVGILLLDVTALHEPAGGFLLQLKRQFPDLVVIVAGKRDTETELAGLISTGMVYRFIHKPMSPGRATLFADAAVKKYEEQRRRLATAPSAVASPPGRRGLWVTAATVVLVAVLATTWAHRPQPADVHGDRLPAVGAGFAEQPLLTRAAAALAANRLTEPRGDNALELYLQAVARSPADPAARAGLAEVRERLSARAENALLEERLDEAAAAIETARKAGVDSTRIAFLSAQLARARAQLKSAAATLRGADARSGKAAADEQQRALALQLAAERIREDRLIEPDRDNARYYVQQALGIDPDNRAAQSAEESLAVALLSDARDAITRRDFPRAVSLLDAANGIASPTNVDNLVQLLRTARRQAEADSWEHLLKTGLERLRRDVLVEPANDSARYYLVTLRSVNPGYAGLAAALHELGDRLVARAREALALRQNDAARNWLNAATELGFTSSDAVAVRRDLDAAAEQQRFLGNVVGANELTLVKSVPAVYPRKAQLSRTEGWVDLDFTVAENGTVEDIAVHDAEPAGTFDAAAMSALAQWRYRPVMRSGVAVTQRARIRIRFALSD